MIEVGKMYSKDNTLSYVKDIGNEITGLGNIDTIEVIRNDCITTYVNFKLNEVYNKIGEEFIIPTDEKELLKLELTDPGLIDRINNLLLKLESEQEEGTIEEC